MYEKESGVRYSEARNLISPGTVFHIKFLVIDDAGVLGRRLFTGLAEKSFFLCSKRKIA